MDRKIKVLHIIGALNLGGAETMIVNIFKTIDRSKYQFDFYLCGNSNGYYENTVRALGGRIYNVGRRSKHPIKYCKELTKLIKKEKYDCIQIHATNSLDGIPAMVTKLGGAKKVCMFSHCTGGIDIRKQKVMRTMFNAFIDEKQACSELAAEWMYGKKASQASIIHLPIDCKICRYDENFAIAEKNKYGLRNKKVLGHIGRFFPQKNHIRLLEIFAELLTLDDSWRLVLIGGGPLKQRAQETVRKWGIEDKVLFLGEFSPASPELSMFDVMILPSLYEGFPTVLLEAQANGLPCIASSAITNSIALTDLVSFVNLEDSNEEWARRINTVELKRVKTDDYNTVISRQYDIEKVTQEFMRIYSGNGEDR